MLKYEHYQTKISESAMTFEFVSEGINGKITKIVAYTEMSNPAVYNLGFGDKHEETGEIDDLSVSDNGDTLKILATVAFTVYTFTEKYPDAWVVATGSTDARTRLYRMGISANLQEIQQDFDIFGLKENNWEIFEPNQPYQAFLLKRK
jgi:hypothetical protein